jgi:O-antigen/teichoic acid export membrane protein
MSRIRKGFQWSAIERVITQAFQLLVLLVLARLLSPQSFGLIAMASVVINISSAISDGGLSNALIRKANPREIEYSTVFYVSIFVSLILYGFMYAMAPLVSNYYDEPSLELVVQLLGLSVVITSFSLVHRAKLTVSLDFRKQALVSVVSAVVSGVAGIYFAYQGYGVWALVIQTLLNVLLNTVLLLSLVKIDYSLGFSVTVFKDLFGYGSKLLASSLMEICYSNLFVVFIGKVFNSYQLGLYYQANRLIELPALTFSAIIQRVSLPVLSQQGTESEFELRYLGILKASVFIFFPLVCGLIVLSEYLIVTILGEQWREAHLYLSILAVGFMIYPIHVLNLNILQSKKRSDLYLFNEICKKVIGVAIFLIAYPYGVVGVCLGIATSSYIFLLVNVYFSSLVSALNIKRQVEAIWKVYLINIVSLLVSFVGAQYVHGIVLSALFGTLIFIVSWYLVSMVFERRFILGIVSELRGNKGKVL